MEPSKSAYYYEIGKPDKIQEQNADISSKIGSIFQENKGRRGIRRVCRELARRGFPVNLSLRSPGEGVIFLRFLT